MVIMAEISSLSPPLDFTKKAGWVRDTRGWGERRKVVTALLLSQSADCDFFNKGEADEGEKRMGDGQSV